MPANLVNGEAGGEGYALVHRLLDVDLGAFGLDQAVGDHACVDHFDADFQVLQDLGQDVYR